MSGLPLQERPNAKKRYERSVSSPPSSTSENGQSGDRDGNGGDGGKEWRRYSEYLRTTSILIPMPKWMWSALPVGVKRTVGCEWPMYVFVPERDGEGGGEQV